MIAALYIRVSTEEQAKEGFSLSAQKERGVPLLGLSSVNPFPSARPPEKPSDGARLRGGDPTSPAAVIWTLVGRTGGIGRWYHHFAGQRGHALPILPDIEGDILGNQYKTGPLQGILAAVLAA